MDSTGTSLSDGPAASSGLHRQRMSAPRPSPLAECSSVEPAGSCASDRRRRRRRRGGGPACFFGPEFLLKIEQYYAMTAVPCGPARFLHAGGRVLLLRLATGTPPPRVASADHRGRHLLPARVSTGRMEKLESLGITRLSKSGSAKWPRTSTPTLRTDATGSWTRAPTHSWPPTPEC